MPVWERTYFGYACEEAGSPELSKIVSSYIPAREQSLNKLFELKDRIGKGGLDLLWLLLDINPNTRISAEKALQHDFFDSIRIRC